jgi:hypothetical protein
MSDQERPDSGPLEDGLDVALATLGQPLTVDDRLAILRQLAEYWHGPISPLDGLPDTDMQGRTLPSPLRWWYKLAGRRREVFCKSNRLLDPSGLMVVQEGLTVFYIENQGVYLWATSLEGDDPPVWGRFNEQDVRWVQEGMTLSEFLIQACLLEGLMQAPCAAAAGWLADDVLERVIAPLRSLPLSPWHWPAYPSRFFVGGGAFVFACPNGEFEGRAGYSVWVGAKTEHSLAYLREVVDESWEYVGF